MTIKTIEWNWKKITKPGCYSKIPLEAYHSQSILDGDSVSSSGLRKLFIQSPAHFYNEWSGNPDRDDEEDKEHNVFGRAAHHLFLGEAFFSKLFCTQPEEYPDKKTGELKKWTYAATHCKDWREARQKEGRAILTGTMVENIKGMSQAMSKHPLIKNGALNGLIERSIFWKDKETGIWLKSRPDAIPGDSGDFVDFKTCLSVQWEDLRRSIYDYGYHQQGALVRKAAREVLKIENPTFTLIFIEKKKPYCIRAVTIKQSELDRGEQQNRLALDTMARCLKSKVWPGPGGDREDAVDIELPDWAQTKIDDRIKFGLAS